jgi:hypothetical protein
MKKIDLSKVDPRLLFAARAAQRAARCYGVPPERMLEIDRECISLSRARWAVCLHLHESGWLVRDIAEAFRLSPSGAFKSVRCGKDLVANKDAQFLACMREVRNENARP